MQKYIIILDSYTKEIDVDIIYPRSYCKNNEHYSTELTSFDDIANSINQKIIKIENEVKVPPTHVTILIHKDGFGTALYKIFKKFFNDTFIDVSVKLI